MTERSQSYQVLALNTAAFTVCFAVWMMYGVLVTFLVDKGLFSWDKARIGWLIGTPILTGALLRLPVGVLTDRFGGRTVFTALLAISAAPTYWVSQVESYAGFLLAGLGFGLTGSSFAVGVAYTSLWFAPERQGTALGVFGMGNMGAALTSIAAPAILHWATRGGADLEGWRTLPKVYAAVLLATAALFWLFTFPRKVEAAAGTPLSARLAPLRHPRVWRFGLYYYFVFGSFVALSQWLIPYYVNVYSMSIAQAGLMASWFSLPAGVVRAFGGYLSDRWGPRAVLYMVFGLCIVLMVLLFPPRMEIRAPGQGIMSDVAGTVAAVSEGEIVIGAVRYVLQDRTHKASSEAQLRLGIHSQEEGFMALPSARSWQEPLVKAGDQVAKKQLIARGVTEVYFQANKWIFSAMVLCIGVLMGIGSAAVYKHIPTYFPESVGVVGGIVGVLGGLGGFVNPILFGWLLQRTGIWTTCWVFLMLVGAASLLCMHVVVRGLAAQRAGAGA